MGECPNCKKLESPYDYCMYVREKENSRVFFVIENSLLKKELTEAQATIAAMRCCGNCGKYKVKCPTCKDLSGWQIAERLVSKGDR